MTDEKATKKQITTDRKDVPVNIGGQQVATNPDLVKSVMLGEKERKSKQMVKDKQASDKS